MILDCSKLKPGDLLYIPNKSSRDVWAQRLAAPTSRASLMNWLRDREHTPKYYDIVLEVFKDEKTLLVYDTKHQMKCTEYYASYAHFAVSYSRSHTNKGTK